MAKVQQQSTLLAHLWRPVHRLSRPFLRLQWKLTFFYTLVTVVAILILELIVLALLAYFTFYSTLLPNLFAQGLVQSSARAAPYLERTPLDRQGLAQWLQKADQSDILAITISTKEDEARTGIKDKVLLTIVDGEGKVLAVSPAEAMPLDAALPARLSPPAATVLQAALRGRTEAEALSARQPDGSIVVAAPIFGENERRLGVLFATLPVSGDDQREFIGGVANFILPSALIVTAFAAVVGTLFGSLMARGLTRRFRTVAAAADAWSRGDFSVLARDRSSDELGQLASRLNLMAEQLQTLVQTRQELAALEERNRLARELHDSVKQEIFATAMQVGAARMLLERNPETAKSHLLEADRLVKQAQQELTGLIQELRPAALAGKGLATALRDYLADWSRQSNIAVEQHRWGERPLPRPVEQMLFRVAQEALANVTRHSEATQVDVQLSWTGDEVNLTISDNGRGFNVNTRGSKGLGLQSIRERVEAMGGHLTVDSQPGRGTSMQVSCKIH